MVPQINYIMNCLESHFKQATRSRVMRGRCILYMKITQFIYHNFDMHITGYNIGIHRGIIIIMHTKITVYTA